MDVTRARKRVLEALRQVTEAGRIELLEDRTLEREWGFVFFAGVVGGPGEAPIHLLAFAVNGVSGEVEPLGEDADIETGLAHYEEQLERAWQSWSLVVEEEASPAVMRKLARILNVKRFERQELARRLPGVVRRGARADLVPFLEALHQAGIAAELRRTRPPSVA